jgi:hypothetical protein
MGRTRAYHCNSSEQHAFESETEKTIHLWRYLMHAFASREGILHSILELVNPMDREG